ESSSEQRPRRPNGRNHGGKIRQEYQLLTRRRLLNGALAVFEKQGFNAATVEDIASAAEVARGTFYLHFKNKMEIVHELTEEIRPSVAELYGDLDAAIAAGSQDVRQVVQLWLVEAIKWYDQPTHRIIAFLWHQLSVEPGTTAVHGIMVDDHMPRYLSMWPPHLRDSARTRVILLSHLLSRAYFLSQRHALPTGDDVVLASLADVWAAGLFPPSGSYPTELKRR
nr:TetR/AcrR family transcriptional regulator [Micromonospora sp. DSM 115978]